MLVLLRGETFIQTIDSNGCIKFGLYIANLVSTIIDNVGANNVVQIFMDNAKNCKATGRILKERYSHVFFVTCNTHSLNLVLNDWYKSDDTTWFKEIIDIACKIVKFILKRQRVLDIF